MAAKRKAAAKARPAAKAKAKAKSRRPVLRTTGRSTKKPAVRKKLAKSKSPAGVKEAGAAAMRFAGVGSEAVMKATGRAWDEWLKVLDRAGAKRMPHKDIADMLYRKFSVPGWWSQMLTVGYEQARGLRLPGQKTDGFSATASKTVAVPLDQLFTAWTEPQRSRWLPGAPLEVKRSSDGKSIRMTWTLGGSSVEVGFADKGGGRSMVAVEHSRLPDVAAMQMQKTYWSEALGRLKAMFEPK
jgi:uncharacterized protein YndB with AHSA1/START domain